MKMQKLLPAACLVSLISFSALAKDSKITFGAIDRVSGGRNYTMLLSSIKADAIFIRSKSSLAGAKVKIREVIYSDGIDAVAVNQDAFFTTQQYKEIFNPNSFDNYQVVDIPESCKGPCLVINAEGFAANDNNLEVVFESAEDEVKLVGLIGLSPRSFDHVEPSGKDPIITDGDDDVIDQDDVDSDQDEPDTVIDLTGTDTRYKTNDFVLDLKKSSPAADGSVTVSNFLISRGNSKLAIYPIPAAYEKICTIVMNSQSAQVIDWNVAPNKLKPSFYLNTDDSLKIVDAQYRLKSVTCTL